MKNRKLLLIVSLVLALTMSLGGTLAYLTDTDEAVNVMTLGNVDIEQYEKDAEGNTFEQNQPLYPAYYTTNNEGNITSAVTGAIDKVVSVKNVGTSEAYVRTLLAFEAGNLNYADFQKYIHTEFEMQAEWLQTPINVKGVNYYVACVDYDKLAAGFEGDASLLKVFMDKAATNEIVAQFGNTYEIVALSQAMQTNNMPDAEIAWQESFGEFKDDADTAKRAAEWFKGVAVIPVTTVSTAAELTAALAEGGTVVLAADLDLKATSETPVIATVPAGVSVVLDLNGHNINANTDPVGSNVLSAVFRVEKGASLTINGDGDVYMDANKDAMNAINAIIYNNAGKVTINGGNYSVELGTTGSWDNDGAHGALIPCIIDNSSNVGDAVLTINGGTFTFDRNMIRNHCQSQQATIIINGGTFIGTDENGSFIWNHKTSNHSKQGIININGGTFVGVKVEDGFTNNQYDPAGENVKTMAPVNTADQLNNALDNGKDVLLTDDIEAPLNQGTIYGTPAAVVQKGGVIDGNGNSLIIENPKYEGYAIETWGGTIKNLTIDTAVGRGIVISSPKEDIYIDNVVVDGPGYAINTTEHSPKKLVITNSTVNGWTSLAGLEVATFTNCNLGENSSKYWQNMGYDKDYDRLVRPYCNAVFTTCVFEQGYYIDLSALGADCKVTLNGCTTNGNKITAENYTTYITIELPSGRPLADCVIFK